MHIKPEQNICLLIMKFYPLNVYMKKKCDFHQIFHLYLFAGFVLKARGLVEWETRSFIIYTFIHTWQVFHHAERQVIFFEGFPASQGPQGKPSAPSAAAAAFLPEAAAPAARPVKQIVWALLARFELNWPIWFTLLIHLLDLSSSFCLWWTEQMLSLLSRAAGMVIPSRATSLNW